MRRLMVITGLLLTAALLLLVSCGAPAMENDSAIEESVGGVTRTPTVPTVPTVKPPSPEGSYSYVGSGAEPAPPVVVNVGEQLSIDRMIVRTGNMRLVVNDVSAAIDRITGLAEDFDGYVVSSQRWEEEERLAGTISIRVPAEHFDEVMRTLRGLAVEVTSEDTSSQDVTEEYIDLSAKLRNLEATEEQLLRLMEKAEKVEDILNVQKELSNTRGQIEQTKGRMQYLERTSATSLIAVQLEQAKLNASFTADKRSVKEGQEVQFLDRIAGGFPPYSYEWDFGDGSTSTSKAATHSYKSVGYYTVILKVTDDEGNTDTQTREEYINVLPGWSAGSIARAAWNGMVTFGHVLANIFIWLGIFSPVWIVIGGIVYWRWRRRRRKTAQ